MTGSAPALPPSSNTCSLQWRHDRHPPGVPRRPRDPAPPGHLRGGRRGDDRRITDQRLADRGGGGHVPGRRTPRHVPNLRAARRAHPPVHHRPHGDRRRHGGGRPPGRRDAPLVPRVRGPVGGGGSQPPLRPLLPRPCPPLLGSGAVGQPDCRHPRPGPAAGGRPGGQLPARDPGRLARPPSPAIAPCVERRVGHGRPAAHHAGAGGLLRDPRPRGAARPAPAGGPSPGGQAPPHRPAPPRARCLLVHRRRRSRPLRGPGQRYPGPGALVLQARRRAGGGAAARASSPPSTIGGARVR